MKSFIGKQNYFEFNSLRNWKPVQVEQNRGDAEVRTVEGCALNIGKEVQFCLCIASA